MRKVPKRSSVILRVVKSIFAYLSNLITFPTTEMLRYDTTRQPKRLTEKSIEHVPRNHSNDFQVK